MGFQEMLLHFHPLFALFIIPIFILIGLVLIPYIDYKADTRGVWFASFAGRQLACVSFLIAAAATPLFILADEYFFNATAWMPVLPAVISNGVIPICAVGVGSAIFYYLMKRRYSAANNETAQMLFVLFLTVFIIMTVTGIWFRGEGMKLVWP